MFLLFCPGCPSPREMTHWVHVVFRIFSIEERDILGALCVMFSFVLSLISMQTSMKLLLLTYPINCLKIVSSTKCKLPKIVAYSLYSLPLSLSPFGVFTLAALSNWRCVVWTATDFCWYCSDFADYRKNCSHCVWCLEKLLTVAGIWKSPFSMHGVSKICAVLVFLALKYRFSLCTAF